MIDKILEQRGSRYGTFADHAVIAQSLQDVIRAQPNWSNLKPDARQALTVICDKIARMLNGDPEYDDNWTDIIGYATLVLNRIHADEREKEEAAKELARGLSPQTVAAPGGGVLMNAIRDAFGNAPTDEPAMISNGIVYTGRQVQEMMDKGELNLTFQDTAPSETDPT